LLIRRGQNSPKRISSSLPIVSFRKCDQLVVDVIIPAIEISPDQSRIFSKEFTVATILASIIRRNRLGWRSAERCKAHGWIDFSSNHARKGQPLHDPDAVGRGPQTPMPMRQLRLRRRSRTSPSVCCESSCIGFARPKTDMNRTCLTRRLHVIDFQCAAPLMAISGVAMGASDLPT